MKRIMMVLAMLLSVAAAQAGVSYSAVTRAKDDRGLEKEVSKMRAVVDGMNARVDIASHGGPIPNGAYLLTRDGGKTVTMVDPAKKTYTKWDIDQLAGMAGSIMQMSGGLLDMKVTHHESEKVLDEKGPALLGVPTRHYKFRTSYGMEMTIMGFKQKTDVATEQEIWAGQGLDDDAMALWKRITSFKTGLEDIDKLMAAEAGKLQGFPLKTIVVSRTTDQKGRVQTSETTTEVTEMKKFAPAKTVFEIPAGFTEEEMVVPGVTSEEDDQPPAQENNPAAAINSFLRGFGRKGK